ncbi:MAG TPA: hypothetical protein VII70_01235 [Steroidobacteraceae bacterium]
MNSDTRTAGADAPQALAAVLASAAFVALALYLAPALVTLFIARLGFSAAAPGYVIAAEMAGMGIATFPALWWLRRIPWGRLAALMLLVIAAGDGLSILMTTPLTLGATRFVTGAAEGTVSIICMSALRLTRDPNRSFGLWLFAQLLAGALALLGLPTLITAYGIAGFYAALALLALALAGIGLRIPSGHVRAPARESSPATVSRWSLVGIAGLVSVLAFYVSFSAIWTFAGQMAAPGAVSQASIARALSLAPLGGMAGAALASAIGTRFGSSRPLAVATSILALAIMMLGRRPEWLVYAAACFAVLFGWTLAVPFLLGGIASVDRSGRLTAAVNIVIGSGLAAGPALAALIVGNSGRYGGVVAVAFALAALSFLLALPMLRTDARTVAQ